MSSAKTGAQLNSVQGKVKEEKNGRYVSCENPVPAGVVEKLKNSSKDENHEFMKELKAAFKKEPNVKLTEGNGHVSFTTRHTNKTFFVWVILPTGTKPSTVPDKTKETPKEKKRKKTNLKSSTSPTQTRSKKQLTSS